MKKCKKLLACLLAGAMVLAMLTACEGGINFGIQLMGLKRATEADVAELCSELDVKYDRSLSDDAYIIANWIASYPVSCTVTEMQLERKDSCADFVAKTFLQQERYASAFSSMGIYTANEFIPGFKIDCDLESTDSDIKLIIPAEGSTTAYMLGAASKADRMGVAYIVVGENRYVVAVFA